MELAPPLCRHLLASLHPEKYTLRERLFDIPKVVLYLESEKLFDILGQIMTKVFYARVSS